MKLLSSALRHFLLQRQSFNTILPQVRLMLRHQNIAFDDYLSGPVE